MSRRPQITLDQWLGVGAQSCDPLPWLEAEPNVRHSRADVARGVAYNRAWRGLNWAPRHEEFDPSVNRILDEFRREVARFEDVTTQRMAQIWLDDWDHVLMDAVEQVTVGEAAHALRVLTLLAGAR